jgi:hypothetical protein
MTVHIAYGFLPPGRQLTNGSNHSIIIIIKIAAIAMMVVGLQEVKDQPTTLICPNGFGGLDDIMLVLLLLATTQHSLAKI